MSGNHLSGVATPPAGEENCQNDRLFGVAAFTLILKGEKSEETAATTATLPPPIKSARRVRPDREGLDTGDSVADTDGTAGDVTADSGGGFIRGERRSLIDVEKRPEL